MISTSEIHNGLASYLSQSSSAKVSALSQRSRVEQSETVTFSESGDTVTLNSSISSLSSLITYSSSMTLLGVDTDNINRVRDMVSKVFQQQGLDLKFNAGDQEVDLQKLSQQDAASLVAKDGYFGVDKTSDRIVQFAIGIAGGDPSKIDAIRQGIENGFQEAQDAFGGWLPDISHETYDAISQKLDAWVSNSRQVS